MSSLSEDERSRLGEIEAHIRATDPGFVGRFQLGNARRRHRRLIITLWVVLFVGVSLFANGVSAAKGLISLGVVAALVGAVVTGWTTLLLVRHRGWHAVL